MAISPLYLLKESYNFSLDTIAIKCPNNAFAAVHGVYNQAWDNGRHPDTGERIPGAFDSRGEELAVKLPKPLLTGKNRKPLTKDPSWSIGDLGIAKSSQTFSDGSIVQLFRDDGSTTPLWALVKGETHYTCADRQPGAYAGLLHVERIVPQFEQEKAAEEYSPGDYVRTDQLTKEQLTEFAEAIIGKGANPSEWRNYGHSPSIFKLFGWKADGNKTFFGDNAAHFTNDITQRFAPIEREKPRKFIIGTYVDARELTDEQIERFVEDAIPHVKHVENKYMRYLRAEFPYLTIDTEKDLWTKARVHTFMTHDVTSYYQQGETPMTSPRNPFQVGDKVVPNGFAAGTNGRHFHGCNSTMERWETEKTVLTVKGSGGTTVSAGTTGIDGATFSYHFSELRMATQEEIEAAKPKPPPAPEVTLERGMIIKHNDRVGMVASPQPDNDGDIQVCWVDTGHREYFRVKGTDAKPFTILGRIMLDGDFRPAEAAASPASDPRTWKKGQRVRCTTNRHAYVTNGRVYTLLEDAHERSDGSVRIVVRDNDGDRANYIARSGDFTAA